MVGISATFKDLKDEGVVVPLDLILFSSLTRGGRETDGF